MSIDREKILKQPAHVMNQLAEGEENVSRHRKATAELERAGQDASLAQKMLNTPSMCGRFMSPNNRDWKSCWAKKSMDEKG
jgi:hypothetical protein